MEIYNKYHEALYIDCCCCKKKPKVKKDCSCDCLALYNEITKVIENIESEIQALVKEIEELKEEINN